MSIGRSVRKYSEEEGQKVFEEREAFELWWAQYKNKMTEPFEEPGYGAASEREFREIAWQAWLRRASL